MMLFVIKIYQRYLRRAFPSQCCFVPSCSEYARECIENFGEGRAIKLIVFRILRCHRFSKGGWDPIPEK